MTTVDLSRIPEVYRERVQREANKAREELAAASFAAAGDSALAWASGDVESDAVIARYLAIADKADLAAALVPPYEGTKEDVEQARLDARAKVWADELAKLDAPAEPPPGYWSTGVAVERQAAPDPVADMRAEAAAARDPMAARMMSMTAGAWGKAAERGARAENGPLCEWGLCREPLSAQPRPGCHEPHLHAVEAKAEDDTLPTDLAADAEQAVRAAQRAHLDATRAAFTGTVRTEARLDIRDAAGLRVALDGLVRYLAGKPRETIAAIVALLKTLPLGYAPKIDLGGCDEGAAALAIVAALPRAYTGATARENGTPLYYAHAEVDGVELTARHAPTPPVKP